MTARQELFTGNKSQTFLAAVTEMTAEMTETKTSEFSPAPARSRARTTHPGLFVTRDDQWLLTLPLLAVYKIRNWAWIGHSGRLDSGRKGRGVEERVCYTDTHK